MTTVVKEMKQAARKLKCALKTAQVSNSAVMPGYVKTLAELRAEFESMAIRCMFDTKRDEKTGEYVGSKGQTFILWAGYWECAKENKIIVGDDALIWNMHT